MLCSYVWVFIDCRVLGCANREVGCENRICRTFWHPASRDAVLCSYVGWQTTQRVLCHSTLNTFIHRECILSHSTLNTFPTPPIYIIYWEYILYVLRIYSVTQCPKYIHTSRMYPITQYLEYIPSTLNIPSELIALAYIENVFYHTVPWIHSLNPPYILTPCSSSRGSARWKNAHLRLGNAVSTRCAHNCGRYGLQRSVGDAVG